MEYSPRASGRSFDFGYALTGAKNRPAVPAALGYEVDKMSAKSVTSYTEGIHRTVEAVAGRTVRKKTAILYDG